MRRTRTEMDTGDIPSDKGNKERREDMIYRTRDENPNAIVYVEELLAEGPGSRISQILTTASGDIQIATEKDIIELNPDCTKKQVHHTQNQIYCLAHSSVGISAAGTHGRYIDFMVPAGEDEPPRISLKQSDQSGTISRLIPDIDGAGTFRVLTKDNEAMVVTPGDKNVKNVKDASVRSSSNISHPRLWLADSTMILYGCGYIGRVDILPTGAHNEFVVAHRMPRSRFAAGFADTYIILIDTEADISWKESLQGISCITAIGPQAFLLGTMNGKLLRMTIRTGKGGIPNFIESDDDQSPMRNAGNPGQSLADVLGDLHKNPA